MTAAETLISQTKRIHPKTYKPRTPRNTSYGYADNPQATFEQA